MPGQTEDPKTTPCVLPCVALLLVIVTLFPSKLAGATQNDSLAVKRFKIYIIQIKLNYAHITSNFAHLFVHLVFSMH